MRLFLLILSFLFSTFVRASEQEPYSFEFFDKDNTQYIYADLNGMSYIGETNSWSLVAHWEPNRQNKKYQLMHSITLYREPQEFNNAKFERIFSYGIIDCSTNELHILNEFYTDDASQVVYMYKFDYWQYVVDLNRNVILQTLLIYSCRSEET